MRVGCEDAGTRVGNGGIFLLSCEFHLHERTIETAIEHREPADEDDSEASTLLELLLSERSAKHLGPGTSERYHVKREMRLQSLLLKRDCNKTRNNTRLAA